MTGCRLRARPAAVRVRKLDIALPVALNDATNGRFSTLT